jgi:cytochrome c oxidase subunit 4
MDEAHDQGHKGPDFKTYMIIFGALSIFTAISFIVNATVGRNMTGLMIILTVAVVKAILVGVYFMHLILDWPRLYYLIFPTFILAAMFITVLLPDIVLSWHVASPIYGKPGP